MGKLFQLFPDRYCGGLLTLLLLGDKEREEKSGEKIDDDTNNNGGEGCDDDDDHDDDEYANSGENVGRTELINNNPSSPLPPPPVVATEKQDDDGVHIQEVQTGKTKKKQPVYLTLLRKDAIRSLILQQQQHNIDSTLSPLELESEVDASFNVWMEARAQSISQNFAPYALETLSQLKSSLLPTKTTTSTNNKKKKVYIGAITDGNSNPQSVPELYGLFDFVIKAEDVGVSKPDKRVYKAAVAEVMLQLIRDGRSVEEFFLGEQFEGSGSVAVDASSYLMGDNGMQEPRSWKDVDPDAVEAFSEAVGPWWVHIGDDFFKDIVAAKEFRMRSVWVRELIGGAKAFGGGGGGASAAAADSTTTSKRERSVEDLVNDITKSKGAITMAIGDSDFLTNALHEEFSDAILDRFADLSDLLIQWNEEGGGKNESAFSEEEEMTYSNVKTASEAESTTISAPPPPQNDESERASTKFCFACGEKIPAVAKFCPACGERQS